VRASHLLIKHAQSRRPSSWKEAVVTRSPEEARADVERLRGAILTDAGARGGDPAALAAAFAAAAARESHCSSARAGGDLGAFGRGAMQAAFEGPAFALGVGDMSGVVSTDSGMHIILRTA
jgi:NIMA-interacting peptidyl-prolyl cis-trans isomerase 1